MSIHSSISEQELEKLANDIFLSSNNDINPINNTQNNNEYVENKIKSPDLDLNKIDTSENFIIENPQTSLKDPFFHNQEIPKAVAGDGKFFEHENNFGNINSSYLTQLYPDLPFADNKEFQNFENLSTINPDKFKSQIPNDFSDNPFSYLEDVLTNVFINDIKGSSVGEDLSKFTGQTNSFDINSIRNDFAILSELVNGRRLVWFDNAATTQKPNAVIDRLSYFYKHENSNIHRAAHELAARATDAYEEARATIQKFINSNSPNEIVFTRGTTESINLVACTWGSENLKEGDEIIISNLEHHANIVPWQLLSKKNGFKIKVIPVNDNGELLIDEYEKLLTPNTKLVSFTHVSNALGTITPAKRIIDLAHQAGAKVLLDGAQSISHIKVDVEQLQPDFFVFSGHKIFGPTGIGVLYAKEELLNSMKPYQGGGNMIQDVTFEKTLFQNSPNRFEAGTGNIADAVGLGEALKYVNKIGIDNIANYEHKLLEYAIHLFSQIPGVKLIGTAKDKTSVMSFTLKGFTNDEVGKILNEHGIAVRTGHHCAQPILRRLGYETTIRPSFAFYNTFEEIDLFASIIKRIV